MPSTFTDSLRLEEQGIGENNNTWGERLNRTIEFADKAIAGVVDIAVASGTVTLTAQNNSEDEARYRILRLTGTLTGNVTVQVPEVSKEYIVIDATTRGGNSITFRLGAGGATQVLPVLGSTQLATNGSAWVTPAFHPASDAEVNAGTDEYKWVTPAGLKQHLGTVATQDVGTGADEIPDTEILDTRLGTSGNLGDAAQRDVGTGSDNLVETSRLDTRLGTTGNLGTAARKDEGPGSGLNADLLDGVQGSGYLKKSEFDPANATLVWSGSSTSVDDSELSDNTPGVYYVTAGSLTLPLIVRSFSEAFGGCGYTTSTALSTTFAVYSVTHTGLSREIQVSKSDVDLSAGQIARSYLTITAIYKA